MPAPRFRLADYLPRGEAFHLGRTELTAGPLRGVHSHDFFECFWLERGAARHWIDDRRVDFGPGRVVFVRPDDRHGLTRRGAAPCSLVNVAFSARTAAHLAERYRDDLAGRFFWSDDALPQQSDLDERQQRELRRLADALERGPRSLARIERFLLELTTRLLEPGVDALEGAPAWLAEACRSVREPEVFRHGAAGFVAVADRSHEHVCRTVRRHLGVTPTAYVNRIRMEYAGRRLAESDDGIVAIAFDCGLENLSHFYSLFRERFGTTPRAYRRRARVDLVQPRA